jgi:hypothetical protein
MRMAVIIRWFTRFASRQRAGWPAAALCASLAQAALCAQNTERNLLKYEEPRSLTGRIYAKGSDRKNVLFNFTRQSTRSGETLQVLREYMYPDGKPAARERLVYDGNNLVSYELEELQTGGRGRADIRREPGHGGKGRICFEYSNDAASRAKPKTDSESLQKDTLINDMVGPFLKSHWEALVNGREVKCRYIVVPRRETVGFCFRKESESTCEGRSVMIVKMQATSPVIAALIDPLFFTIEKNEPNRVLEYVGGTTPKIKSGGKWKDLDVVTVFDWK